MSNQTNKKSPQDRGDNEEKDINMSLRSIWLGRRFLNRTFSMQEDDPEIGVYEIQQLLSDDP